MSGIRHWKDMVPVFRDSHFSGENQQTQQVTFRHKNWRESKVYPTLPYSESWQQQDQHMGAGEEC